MDIIEETQKLLPDGVEIIATSAGMDVKVHGRFMGHLSNSILWVRQDLEITQEFVDSLAAKGIMVRKPQDVIVTFEFTKSKGGFTILVDDERIGNIVAVQLDADMLGSRGEIVFVKGKLPLPIHVELLRHAGFHCQEQP